MKILTLFILCFGSLAMADNSQFVCSDKLDFSCNADADTTILSLFSVFAIQGGGNVKPGKFTNDLEFDEIVIKCMNKLSDAEEEIAWNYFYNNHRRFEPHYQTLEDIANKYDGEDEGYEMFKVVSALFQEPNNRLCY